MKILIADDDATIIRIASLGLRRKGGHEVLCAADGAEACRMAATERPDLIVLDVLMSGMGGLEACGKLKEAASTRDIPVIFLTANAENFNEERARAAGAIGCIGKPFRPAALTALVEKILAGQREEAG